MSHSNNISSSRTDRWIDDGGTLNPAPVPATSARDKDLRDTAAGCRERATADMLSALAMATANGRQVFEKSAASWTKRADMLQRIETGIEARINAPELTREEAAEDLLHPRL